MTIENWRTHAFGYAAAPYRIEHRPTFALDSRETLLGILDALHAADVKAWWYSCSAKGSYPLFPSKHLPYRDDADAEIFPWLSEQAHQRGIALFSWGNYSGGITMTPAVNEG